MNALQYAKYERDVADFLKRNNVKPGCHSPKNAGAGPHFSWRACECCGSSLGGDRETYTFAMDYTSGETFDANICTDCVYYLAYAQLDDTTMMEIEESKKGATP
jgi:hypothetical protein